MCTCLPTFVNTTCGTKAYRRFNWSFYRVFVQVQDLSIPTPWHYGEEKQRNEECQEEGSYLHGDLPNLDVSSEDEDENCVSSQGKNSKSKDSHRSTNDTFKHNFTSSSGSGTKTHMDSLLSKTATKPARIPEFQHREDTSFEEWKRNNPCLLDMHVGHAVRKHKLLMQEWEGPLSDRWNRNRNGWNVVRNLAPFKKPEQIAETFNVDLTG